MRAARIDTILDRSAAAHRPEIRQLLEKLSDRELLDMDLSNELKPLKRPDLAAELPLDRLTRLVFRGRPDLLARLTVENEAICEPPTGEKA